MDRDRAPSTVSVAMATYMGAAYLRAQLDSIVRQTIPPAEIVVCDDCSSDGTAQLVADFALTSEVPVRLFVNPERLGWRANFMRAASLCESELIAFCDQDDLWDPRKLEVVALAFAHADTLMAFHDATVVGPDLARIAPFRQRAGEPDQAGPLQRRPWRDVYGFTIVFRRELLALWGHWPSSLDKSVGGQPAAHDQWLLFLGGVLGTTQHVRRSLASYRQHDRNAVGVKDAFRRSSRVDGFLGYRDVVNLRLVVLDARIRTLREIGRRPDRFGRAAAAALVVHTRYRQRVALQTAVHSSHSRIERRRAFGALLSSASYSGDVWALGRLQVLDDLLAAVLGPAGVERLRRLRSRRGVRGRRPPA